MREGHEAEAVGRLLAPLAAQRGAFPPGRQEIVWRAIEARVRRRRSAWRWGGGLAAAATTALSIWASRPPPPVEVPSAAPVVAERAPAAEAGARIGDGVRGLPSGARIEVSGRVHVVAARPELTRLRLERGAVRSVVPGLAAGQRFLVSTPHAEVEVRGTVFRVALADGGGTAVAVEEGRVEVRPDRASPPRVLTAGQRLEIEPSTAAGADRAAERGDGRQAAEIRAALALAEASGLAGRNRLLRAGRALDAATEDATWFWARVIAAHADGAHAEEFAFRHAAALRRAGRLAPARAAAAAFRARFPHSARAADTLGW